MRICGIALLWFLWFTTEVRHSPLVSQKQLYVTCPRCFEPFVMKGSRLRKFEKDILRKPDMKGPYCSYHCSCRSNIEKTPTLIKKKEIEARIEAWAA